MIPNPWPAKDQAPPPTPPSESPILAQAWEQLLQLKLRPNHQGLLALIGADDGHDIDSNALIINSSMYFNNKNNDNNNNNDTKNDNNNINDHNNINNGAVTNNHI